MRTFDMLRTLKNMVSSESGERKYTVSGSFAFQMSWHRDRPDLTKFREAILEIDQLFPWHDDVCLGAGEPKGIFYVSDGKEVVQNWSIPEKVCCFNVFPRYSSLRRGQVYAYEKYLAKIAEELAKRKLPNVCEVTSVIHVHSGTSFRVE